VELFRFWCFAFWVWGFGVLDFWGFGFLVLGFGFWFLASSSCLMDMWLRIVRAHRAQFGFRGVELRVVGVGFRIEGMKVKSLRVRDWS